MILVHALIAVPATDITPARRKWMDENSEYVQLNRRQGKLLLDVLIPRRKLVNTEPAAANAHAHTCRPTQPGFEACACNRGGDAGLSTPSKSAGELS